MNRPYSGWNNGTTTLFLLAWIRPRIVINSGTYWSGQLDEMLSTMACSFARISVCRSDNLAFLVSSSKDATMYSISRHGQHTNIPAESMPQYLVTPEQFISTTVLDPIPCMQELGDAMRSDVVGELLRVFPGQGGTQG